MYAVRSILFSKIEIGYFDDHYKFNTEWWQITFGKANVCAWSLIFREEFYIKSIWFIYDTYGRGRPARCIDVLGNEKTCTNHIIWIIHHFTESVEGIWILIKWAFIKFRWEGWDTWWL